jgi:glycosyltransferase involved in cell wall biosynthesis
MTTTQWLKKDLTKRYGESTAGKISVVPHSYDSELFSRIKRVDDSDVYTVAHIGNLYGVRTAVPLIVAANRLAEDGALPQGFRIRLVGFIEKLEAAAIKKEDHHGLVEMTGLVSYERSLVEMISADLLLAIDGPGDASHPFLPSKIIEYIGTGNRILALTEKGSPSSAVAAELGAVAASPADVNDIGEGLKRSISASSPDYGDGKIRKYSAAAVAMKLNGILQQFAGSRG